MAVSRLITAELLDTNEPFPLLTPVASLSFLYAAPASSLLLNPAQRAMAQASLDQAEAEAEAVSTLDDDKAGGAGGGGGSGGAGSSGGGGGGTTAVTPRKKGKGGLLSSAFGEKPTEIELSEEVLEVSAYGDAA